MVEKGMKLIPKDNKSIPSNNFVIIEQPQYKAKYRKQPGKPLEVLPTGKMQYVVYQLETPGVLDENAFYKDFFYTLEEAKKEYPDVELVKFKDIPKDD